LLPSAVLLRRCARGPTSLETVPSRTTQSQVFSAPGSHRHLS